MKKMLSAVLAAGLVLSTTGMVSAQSTEVKEPSSQTGKFEDAIHAINSLHASVVLTNEKYHVRYSEEKGKVKIHIQKESGNEKIEVTEEQAIEEMKQFVSELELNRQMSKQKIVQRISDALGVKPADVQFSKTSVTFNNQSQLTFLYKKGNKASDYVAPSNVNLNVEDVNGQFVRVKLSAKNDKIIARYEIKTTEEHKVYKGWAALRELNRLGVTLHPDEDTDLNSYYNSLAKKLGVSANEVKKANMNLLLSNQTMVHFNYVK
ncbi:YusW family protein [Bacillus sp. CECT 9360]|uniref:YusW family protein n=1 Tax=Bacillus sp. CECT 9360 TaxID=2845821 RepID=UPI001E347465|nr:YusW family protein [Bacillus sp. CECT 9360]CAH0344253.1 hypothetical protein BCI9360_00496 [Bacillus sp. CECT 9360]